MLRWSSLLLAFWLATGTPPAAAQGSAPAASVRPAARQLEAGLIAPCCWRETLDVHQSPIADQLRRELRQRLAAGESAEAIEADLVARYGPKLRATLPSALGYLLFGLCALGGLAVLTFLGARTGPRVRAAADRGPGDPFGDPERQQYEDQLDDDLAASPR